MGSCGVVDPFPDSTRQTHTCVGVIAGGEEPAGLNKRERRRQKRDQQEARRASEAAQLGQPMPGGAAEFERLLEETPDKAVLWIQYMAFMLSLGEVAKARAVAEKALDSINYRHVFGEASCPDASSSAPGCGCTVLIAVDLGLEVCAGWKMRS